MRVPRDEPIHDSRQNSVAFDQHIAIRKSQHYEPFFDEQTRPSLVLRAGVVAVVLAAVELDDQLRLEASEVGEEPGNRTLAPELVPGQTTVAKP